MLLCRARPDDCCGAVRSWLERVRARGELPRAAIRTAVDDYGGWVGSDDAVRLRHGDLERRAARFCAADTHESRTDEVLVEKPPRARRDVRRVVNGGACAMRRDLLRTLVGDRAVRG